MIIISQYLLQLGKGGICLYPQAGEMGARGLMAQRPQPRYDIIDPAGGDPELFADPVMVIVQGHIHLLRAGGKDLLCSIAQITALKGASNDSRLLNAAQP
jgi:hypothetical protein